MTSSAPLPLRAAEMLYWLARYIERSRHTAQILFLAWQKGIDCGECGKTNGFCSWVHQALRVPLPKEAFDLVRCLQRLQWEPTEPLSLRSCLLQARANARELRFYLPGSLWRECSRLYDKWAFPKDPPNVVEIAGDLEEVFERTLWTEALLVDWISPGAELAELGIALERTGNLSAVLVAQWELGSESFDWPIVGSLPLEAAGLWEKYRLMEGPRVEGARVWKSFVGTPESKGSLCHSALGIQKAVVKLSAWACAGESHFEELGHRIRDIVDTENPRGPKEPNACVGWCVKIQALCNQIHQEVWEVLRKESHGFAPNSLDVLNQRA